MRSIKYLVDSVQFQELWKEATEKDQANVEKMIASFDKAGLLSWVRLHDSIDYGEMSWTGLMHYAKEYRVKNYSRLDRRALIKELERERDERKRSANWFACTQNTDVGEGDKEA